MAHPLAQLAAPGHGAGLALRPEAIDKADGANPPAQMPGHAVVLGAPEDARIGQRAAGGQAAVATGNWMALFA
ncbi:hypothetical protein QC820_16245 [Halomonas mongoliensis]|uniref:Uncharacterized protein n=1 Tax=Halomonas mongoliensis TaxID=321265 RepID=A0ABU1GR81_9GAMM|nr:hypothetical protein [Halomonas mongoliensis]MDR5894340.1 hypothetical protein [Halomonas mongoliensis]